MTLESPPSHVEALDSPREVEEPHSRQSGNNLHNASCSASPESRTNSPKATFHPMKWEKLREHTSLASAIKKLVNDLGSN